MGQNPRLDDFYRHERNEYETYVYINMWKKTIQSVMVISGIILLFRLIGDGYPMGLYNESCENQ